MAGMQLRSDIYQWLKDMGVISGKEQTLKSRTDPNIVVLSPNVTHSFESGQKIADILTAVFKRQHIDRPINTLKKMSSPASKVYNWQQLSEALRDSFEVVGPKCVQMGYTP